jgi:hypothetical protein
MKEIASAVILGEEVKQQQTQSRVRPLETGSPDLVISGLA